MKVSEIHNPDINKVEGIFRSLLDELYPFWKGDAHLLETPKRLAKMYVEELFAGLYAAPPEVKLFPRGARNNSDAIQESFSMKKIPYLGLCPHHFMPIEGEVDVKWKYIPGNGEVPLIGLSKVSRWVQWLAKKPITQEQFTYSLVKDLFMMLTSVEPKLSKNSVKIKVVVRAKHLCMSHRGVLHNPLTVTKAVWPESSKNKEINHES